MARTGLTVALLAASVMALGCEGDDEDSATPRTALERDPPAQAGTAPAKPKFVADTNALCTEAKQRAAPISDAIEAKVAREDAAGVAAELRKALPIADELVDKIAALKPPAGDEAIVARYLALVAEQTTRTRTLVRALMAEDILWIEDVVADLRKGNQRAKRLADDYGFMKCGPEGLPNIDP